MFLPLLIVLASPALPQDHPAHATPQRALPPLDAAVRASLDRALERGAGFLLGCATEGGWGFEGHRDAALTSMALGGLVAVAEPRPEAVQHALDAGLDWLGSLQREDGSIHEGQLVNYVTSASVMALAMGGREQDLPRLARARDFLRTLQVDEGEGVSEGDRFYGGIGYNSHDRPDLSNLQMALEALHATGAPADDPAYSKALKFLQRCQNRSESNDVEVVADGTTTISGGDGGGTYLPGDSKAGFLELPDGRRVPRSYGSMSYALLKGYLFAGLERDDPRVQALWKWLTANYTLDVNPGFEASDDPHASYQGLFYYYLTMARGLELYGEATLTDGAGVEHDWRAELVQRLVAMQRPDGSWINDHSERWFEGNPVLASAYAMQVLGVLRGE
jgi:squalene-hopene/tetraprenyl-beta-curcumene cyclase